MKRKIAIIPARGGSKRLPRKNILPFLGRPIIHYTIEAALKTHLFDVVAVSTEDPEIKEIVKGTGCELHEREQTLATDTARVPQVLNAALSFFEKKYGPFETFCCLYATAPLRDALDIANAYELLLSENANFCVGVTEFEKSPFFAFNLLDNKRIVRRWPEVTALPPQKRPPLVVDNGSMYWVKTAAFRQAGEVIGDETVGYSMPRWKSIDIDTRDDFELAEYFAKKYYNKLPK